MSRARLPRPEYQLDSALEKMPIKELKLTKTLIDNPPPHVSSTNWAIYDARDSRFLFGKEEKERREVASLTKIMTCHLVLFLCDKWKFDISTERITISITAEDVDGTSADLTRGDSFTIEELLFGLMLPSGNDAATAFAEHFGEILLK